MERVEKGRCRNSRKYLVRFGGERATKIEVKQGGRKCHSVLKTVLMWI